MQTLIRAEFLGTPVSILDHAGRRWLTARDVGRCLGYAEIEAANSINRLYNRHADEFGPEDQGSVKLTGPRGPQDTRIFSQTGCILLAMFANTARAKDFRAWAKRALAGEAPLAPAARPWPRINRTVERQAMDLYVAGLSVKQVARHLGISVSVASNLLNGKYRFPLNAGADETTPELIAAVAARKAEEAQARIAAEFCQSLANQRLAAALDRIGLKMLAALEPAVEG